ncbi:beta-ketoacyl-ACP synthase III [Neptunomonas qingdaonensis]|uniref:Beta-ketodecanoyl-[acyl-carrier-protein] synthase n=1 Tax=Neptunomonas qingdaonensis TaxID=1045558 RepID=A0A1I2RRW4_9GAMM|nr:beta-ketoacyl-ACP synthase III [Neptunomonas qingdaonensis]SFG40496.1 beta-ketodecanoyl-[acyl-carrier-protein] synthase [Neptunomonas qingdaonensis]
MKQAIISGIGLWTPENSISNEELVTAYNAWATQFNKDHFTEIEAGDISAKTLSTAEFIEKASGIKSRYAYCKEGILDATRMRPLIPSRPDDELSVQAEIALYAAKQALLSANKTPDQIDAVIVACSYTQRAYPAIAIEVQNALGINGFGFDMQVACSSGTFGLHRAYEMIIAGTAQGVLVINPELTSPQVNYCDRDSHFIFGDVAVATVIESAETCQSEHSYEIISTKAATVFSNNIRSNFGYTARVSDTDPFSMDGLFHQNGRKVFKEVCPMAAEHITAHIRQHDLHIENIRRWWLHQANINMNLLITRKLLGRDATADEAPIVLDNYANTASAGSLIAFQQNHEDLECGDYGIICSFGAGYSIGSLLIRKR